MPACIRMIDLGNQGPFQISFEPMATKCVFVAEANRHNYRCVGWIAVSETC